MASGLVVLDVVLREREAVAALPFAVRTIRRYAQEPLCTRVERALEKRDDALVDRTLAQFSEDMRLDELEGVALVDGNTNFTKVVDPLLQYGVRHTHHLDTIIQLLHGSSAASEVQLMNTAAKHGQLDTLKWLFANRRDPNASCQPIASKDAARLGHIDVLEWLYANNRDRWSPQTLVAAVEHEQMDVAQWLFDHEAPVDTVGAMREALKCNSIKMLQWLHDHYDVSCRYWMVSQSIDRPPAFSVLRWLIDHYPDRYQNMSNLLPENRGRTGGICSVQ